MSGRRHHPLVMLLADIGMTVFGLIMALSPLLLWAAPTGWSLIAVVGAVAVSAVLVWVLAGYDTPASTRKYTRRRPFSHDKFKASLPPELIAEAQNLRQMGRNGSLHGNLKDFIQAQTSGDRGR